MLTSSFASRQPSEHHADGEAIRTLAAGHRLTTFEIAGELARHLGQESLTVGELQVLELIECGFLEI